MLDDILPFYNAELRYMRELAKEFAAKNPKIAGRLRLSQDAIEDPHVGRLIEAFAFQNARTRLKLEDDFPEYHVHRWELQDGFADFLGAARVPLRPFLGVMGATPDSDEPLSPFPPGHFGGNIDTRDLIAGTSVFLPVSTPGARVLLGDPHAAQGDGEVCGAAIEASLSGAIRIRLHKGRTIPAPQFRTPGPLRTGIEDRGYFATTGVAPDLMRASQDAVRAMIDHLVRETGLAPLDAYVLCSVAVDLKITEVVDRPNWVVAAYLPQSILV